MRARKMMAKGFTLVEILIVVVILGILAAIVIPQFTNASESAKASSLVSQLQTIRSQIELYKNEHNDAAPDLTTNWNQFTQYSNMLGADLDPAKSTTATPPRIYGPYMQKEAVNPFEDSSSVLGTPTTNGAAAAGVGWVWHNGLLKASMSLTKARDLGLLGATETVSADIVSY